MLIIGIIFNVLWAFHWEFGKYLSRTLRLTVLIAEGQLASSLFLHQFSLSVSSNVSLSHSSASYHHLLLLLVLFSASYHHPLFLLLLFSACPLLLVFLLLSRPGCHPFLRF